MATVDSTNETKENYERAIKARKHHYSNFNYWMNFYAIIIGALFVGYYTIKEDEFLKTIITFIGFATTFAWLQSFRGYYHWIKHWMNVVMFHEDNFIKTKKTDESNIQNSLEIDELRVYTLYYEDEEKNLWWPLKARNISTQKMTLRLIVVLLISWLCLLTYNCYSFIGYKLCDVCEGDCQCGCISISATAVLLLIGFFLLLIFLLFICNKKSEIQHHYRLKGYCGNYHIESPKEIIQNTQKGNNHKIEK